jgi:hypothetical protein
MKPAPWIAAGIVLLFSSPVLFLLYRAHRVELGRAEAASDGEEITRQIKRYWDLKNLRGQLENDLLQLKNDQLEYEIAVRQGKHASMRRVYDDAAIITNDRVALDQLSRDAPMLNPYEASKRIQEHNRKYPFDQLADVTDVIRQMEKFESDINAITDKENGQLRSRRAKH